MSQDLHSAANRLALLMSVCWVRLLSPPHNNTTNIDGISRLQAQTPIS